MGQDNFTQADDDGWWDDDDDYWTFNDANFLSKLFHTDIPPQLTRDQVKREG